jgi:hypothetical protein
LSRLKQLSFLAFPTKKPASEPTEAGFISEGRDLIWREFLYQSAPVVVPGVVSPSHSRQKPQVSQRSKPLKRSI